MIFSEGLMYIIKFVCLACVWSLLAGAQTASLQGPTAGAVYDRPTRSIRAVAGIPGSAYLGAGLVNDVDFAAIAPDGRKALLVAGDKWTLIDRLDEGQPALLFETQAGTPGLAAWSADSSSVAAYDTASATLRLLHTGGAGIECIPIETPAGRVTALAVSKAGKRIAAAIDAGGGAAIYLLSPGSLPVSVAVADSAAAIVFSEDDATLFAAGTDAGRLLAIRNIDSAPEPVSFGEQADTRIAPAGIAVRKQRIYVADRAANLVHVFDASGLDELEVLPLETTPAQLTPLSSGALLLNTRQSVSDTVWILDTTRRPAVYFVPAGE